MISNPNSNSEIHWPSLVIAHPGHELRLFGWVATEKPTIHILASGARNGANGRVDASANVVAALGARKGLLFGEMLDRDLYAAILGGDIQLFHDWIDVLRDAFIANRPSFVVVDGWELYNVAHDLVHVMTRVSASEASLRLGRSLKVYDFAVVPAAFAGPIPSSRVSHTITLSHTLLEQKLATARAYPDIGSELMEILTHDGLDSLADEKLRSPLPFQDLLPDHGVKPLYESYGEQRVSDGIYKQVIRWSHVAPIVESITDRLDSAV